MYRAHLEHCFQHIERSRILIIDHEALEKRMPETMDLVQKHTSLDYMNFSQITTAMAESAFDKEYPGFKNNTGWGGEAVRITRKTYMPQDMKDQLNAFFHPDVDEIRRLSGLTLDGWP